MFRFFEEIFLLSKFNTNVIRKIQFFNLINIKINFLDLELFYKTYILIKVTLIIR